MTLDKGADTKYGLVRHCMLSGECVRTAKSRFVVMGFAG